MIGIPGFNLSIFYILLLSLSPFNASFSQNFNTVFEHFSTREGLSHNRINGLFQDSRGFIWIATSDGLNCYDGKNFKSYFHSDNDPNSPLGNNWGFIDEDPDGNILLGGSEGLSLFITKQNKFKTVFIPIDTTAQEHGIVGMLIDKNNHIWCATRFEVYELDISYNIKRAYKNEFCGNDVVWNIRQDKSGNIWINKGGSLNMISNNDRSVLNIKNTPEENELFKKNTIGDIAFDQHGKTWTIETSNSIVSYDNSMRETSREKLNDSTTLKNIFHTPSGKTWIASASVGIFSYDPFHNRLTNFSHDEKKPGSLTNNDITTILEDNAGNTWIGTIEGLNVLSYKPCPIQVWNNFSLHPKTPTEFKVNGITLYNNSLWVAIWGVGISRIDLTTGKKEIYETGKSDIYRCVWDLFPVKNELWYGNFHGLNKFNPETKKISGIKNNPSYTHNLDSFSFFGFYEDNYGAIWAALGNDNGIIRYDKKSELFQRYTHSDTGKYSFPFRHYSAIEEDRYGNLWFGYNRSLGIAKYDYTQHKFILLNAADGKPVFNNRVRCLLSDSNFLWVGTDYGLYRMNLQTYDQKRYSRNEGLPNDLVHSIVKDGEGNLWIATDNGLAEFDPWSETFYNFSDKYDFPENVIGNGIYDTKTNRLYFSTEHTVFSFSCDSLKKNHVVLSPQITSFRIMGKETTTDLDSLVTLQADDKYFSFEFTAPYFPIAINNQYAYKLQGYDTSWINIGSRQLASFSRLPYGKYAFHLKASLDGTHWNEMKNPIEILVRAPFYKTSGFILLSIFISILIIVLFVSYFYRLKLQRILLVQQIRNKIASDLHDDIGSTLSSISYMSEIARQKIGTVSPESESWFDRIGESSRTLVENMNDIVWSVNARDDTYEGLLSRMRKFASTILEAKNISFQFESDQKLESKKLSMDERKNLFLIFKEIINNITKHADCKDVLVKLNEEKGRVKLYISDNGKGFDVNQIYSGNGLKNLRKRAQDINAIIEIKSRENSGSEFILSI